MSIDHVAGSLIEEADAEVILHATGDLALVARVNETSASYGQTAGAYAVSALRRYADGATHEQWLSLMTALGQAVDPAAACTLRALAWALDQDEAELEGDLVGALIYDDSAPVNALMSHCANDLIAAGLRVAGLVQTNHPAEPGRRCDMTLRELMSGAVVQVSEHRGPGALGCRLDYSAFTSASQLCHQALARNPDILFVNKFGKLETQGKGLREVMAEALTADIPVLIGVPHRNLKDFESFIDGSYRQLTAGEVQSWCRRRAAARRHSQSRHAHSAALDQGQCNVTVA